MKIVYCHCLLVQSFLQYIRIGDKKSNVLRLQVQTDQNFQVGFCLEELISYIVYQFSLQQSRVIFYLKIINSCLIILIMKDSKKQIKTESNIQIQQDRPNQQEWGIINRYKALQFQRIKQREAIIDRQKKQAFRKQLNNQLSRRINTEEQEKNKDRLFYQQLNQRAEELKRKEDEQRTNKLMNRRMIEEQNLQKIERIKASRIVDRDTGYHLEIGVRSQQEHRAKSQLIQKETMDTLDYQLREKTELSRKSKLFNYELQRMHNQAQDNYFKVDNRKTYSQNKKEIDKERNSKTKEVEYNYIQKARVNRLRAQQQRARFQEYKKQQQNGQVREVLDQQIQQLNKRKYDEKTINPEDISYRFISNMFRPKEQFYDPQKYKQDLRQQAEQQKKRRVTENYMSDEEYRLNMNQLSKAVIGTYARDDYLDRSLASVGDNKAYKLNNLKLDLKDNDADIIKRKMQTLRARQTSHN